MNDTTDSDDSAFLFTTSFSKRKAKNIIDEFKKTTSGDDSQKNETMSWNEEAIPKETGSLTTETNSSVFNCNIIQAELGKESHEKCLVVDKGSTLTNENFNQQKSKLLQPKITAYYSCPLCLKNFDSEITQISHMKQCAKKSKMTPKQLLQALEMHKDQLKKRVNAGLSSLSPLKKKKKTGNQDNVGSSYELALGLALSKSLSEVNPNHLESHNINFKNDMLKNNRTTLESFGFTSSNCHFGGTRRKKLKNWKNAQFALRERTKEQRERLITEKAAVVLLCKDYEIESYIKPEHVALCESEDKNVKDNEKEESLWKLGENEENTNWYVEDIKYFVAHEAGEYVNEENVVNSEECKMVGEIKRLNLPRISVFQDWGKLVNNEHLSDLNFRSKSSETLYLHSIVLYARCPSMLDLNLQNIFGQFNTVTILSFLQYLYCGILDGLKRSEIENLIDLAQSVNFEELCEVLNILKENLNLKSSDRDEITTEWNKTLCQQKENIGNNLDENIKLRNTSYDKDLNKNFEVLDSKSNSSLQEITMPYCEIERVKEDSTQESSKNSENKKEAFWEPNELENVVEHTGTEEQICVTLNGVEDANANRNSLNDKLSTKRGETEDLEGDMFEEEDKLNPISKISADELNIHSLNNEDNINEQILVSSGSRNDEFSNEKREGELNGNNEDFPITDCEIPYFDPYEHFDCEIPVPDSPVLNEEQIPRSQSLFFNEISGAKPSSPCLVNSPRDRENSFPEIEAISPIPIPPAHASDFCSTPIITLDTPKQTPNQNKSDRKSLKKGQGQKSESLCFKRSRSVIASRLMNSKLLRSSSAKKRRRVSKVVKNDEDDSVKDLDILTESILKGFDNSFGITLEKSPETETRKFVEVTPTAAGEQFSEDVSPLPDYSIMSASGIKKHLTKYGLKKSLSKNKAKKILRHIYEELHPWINTTNGKIIKYEPMEKQTQSKKKSEIKRRKSLKTKNLQPVKEKSVNKKRIRKKTRKIPDGDSSDDHSTLTRCEAENTTSSVDGLNSLEGFEEYIFERSDSEIQESQSQTNSSSGKDVTEAVFDYINNNPEIHRQILMYEPIWLESFREQLNDKYNKKYKLTDLMDCLDAECITFRCESQRRTNNTRTRRAKSSKLGNK